MAFAIRRISRLLTRFASSHRVLKQTPAVTCIRFVTRKHSAQEYYGISDTQRVAIVSVYVVLVCWTACHNQLVYIFKCISRTLKRVVSEEAEEELRPYKLPGELNDWTGNVLYPDEESKKWDVNGMTIILLYQ